MKHVLVILSLFILVLGTILLSIPSEDAPAQMPALSAARSSNAFGINTSDPKPAGQRDLTLVTNCASAAGMIPGANVTPEQLRIFSACFDSIRAAAQTKR